MVLLLSNNKYEWLIFALCWASALEILSHHGIPGKRETFKTLSRMGNGGLGVEMGFLRGQKQAAQGLMEPVICSRDSRLCSHICGSSGEVSVLGDPEDTDLSSGLGWDRVRAGEMGSGAGRGSLGFSPRRCPGWLRRWGCSGAPHACLEKGCVSLSQTPGPGRSPHSSRTG